MMLRIDTDTKLKDIQAAFNNAFTYLKLEFFRHATIDHHPSLKKDMRLAGELALNREKTQKIIEIAVDGSWTVCEIEKVFLKAGLCVQVFRKSGNHWIETLLTDDWTLDQQNKEGELFSAFLPPVRDTHN